jgi:hypothetical protein
MSAYSQRKEEITGLTEFLGRRRPAGRLMRRIVREHPEASLEEVVHLFREAALEDPAAFEDVLMQALTRDQSGGSCGLRIRDGLGPAYLQGLACFGGRRGPDLNVQAGTVPRKSDRGHAG